MKTKLFSFFFFLFIGAANAQTPLYHFTFDNANTWWDTNNSVRFYDNNVGYASIFVNGQNGGQALRVQNYGSVSAQFSNLASGGTNRTIAVWVKFNGYDIVNGNYIFSYGSPTNGRAFGLTMNGNTALEQYAWGAGFSSIYNYTFNTSQYYHLVTTYDGVSTRIYINGVLVKTQAMTLNTDTLTNNYFNLGTTPTRTTHRLQADIDDLKIFNSALSDSQVLQLFNGTTSSSPSITNVALQTSQNSVRVNYTLNANNAATTSVVKYGLSFGSWPNQVTGFSASGISNTTNFVDLTGLANNTTYFIRIESTNSVGTTYSSQYIVTTGDYTDAIADYRFNNYLTDINGANPFSSNAGVSFTTDRFGNTSSALNINNTGSSATIPGLPYSNSPRTICFWAKVNVMQNPYNMTFSYGSAGISNACGGSFNSSLVEYFGYANNFNVSSTNSLNTWYFFTYTYDGTNAKIYKNGVLLSSTPKTWNTINNSNIFKLGTGVGGELNFNGAIDDLKIFNYVLTDTQISNLYTNNVLSSSDFNQNNLKVAMYPNPVNDILSIDIENEIKSVEIYNIQGQRVIKSNSKQIETSSLNSGIYMVRIEDTNGGIATQKLIKK